LPEHRLKVCERSSRSPVPERSRRQAKENYFHLGA